MSNPYTIPQKLIDEALLHWSHLAKQAYEVFAVECDLIYLSNSVSAPLDLDNNVPELNSINSRRRSGGADYDYEDRTISLVENSEKINIKIYWNPKEWQQLFGYTTIPNNSILFYAKLEDANRLAQGVRVRYIDTFEKEYTFTKHSEPVPCGFKHEFCSSIWIQKE